MYYRIVLYNYNIVLPFKFNTRDEADDFIFEYNLHAFITILQRGRKETENNQLKTILLK